MNTVTLAGPLLFALHILVQVGLIARVLLRAHRQPASRIAWVVVIIALPIVGILAYLLLGETSVGRQRVQRMRGVLAHLPDPCNPAAMHATATAADLPQRHAHLFEVGKTINGFSPVGGNRAQLTPDSNAAIDAMVTDIDAAQDHVHLVFYIWLADNNGRKVVDALERAAKRGVTCRAMADALGSRAMIESAHWQRMREAGVKVAHHCRSTIHCYGLFMAELTCASARRGVDTSIVFPLKNDSWIVGAASRSYYAELLEAGVRIFEYEGGLLHAKTLTIDAEITLLGSANMDRRSFELNYENNILLFDPALTRAMRERQDSYLAQSQQVTPDMIAEWPWQHRLANNAIAMFGPVL